jgi:pyruvate dehydrogenase E2 component (dihydrolipoamide acetyltransferase)
MPTDIRLPEIAADMKEADLVAWLVAPGDRVSQGDVIVEVETDKATVELESPAAGVLLEILVPAGTTGVPVGQVLARLSDESEATVSAQPASEPTAPEGGAGKEVPARTEEDGSPPGAQAAAAGPADRHAQAVSATALARRLAERAGLDLSRIEGSGAGGRVVKADVERGLAPVGGDPTSETTASSESPTTEGGELIAHSRMRRTIAQRLSQAKREMPHFYLSVECDVAALVSARRRINEQASELRVSLNDFVIRAAGLALREVPEANASWSEDAIVRHADVDISVAVATEGGLVTPIVRNADRKGLAAIAAEMRDLAERARTGRLQPREYRGGSFSVSNLGMYGIGSVYPIVNPPQSCILGVGAARSEPVVRDGELAIGTRMTCTLSADHRVVDGAVGARLLMAICRLLEDPLEMVF